MKRSLGLFYIGFHKTVMPSKFYSEYIADLKAFSLKGIKRPD